MMRRILLAVSGILLGSAVSAQPPDLIPPSITDRGVSESQMIRTLIESLGDSDPEVRIHVGSALARMGPGAVAPLIEALRDKAPLRRAGAAYALAQMKADARTALPVLLETLRDTETAVRRQAAYAISRIVERPERPASLPLPEVPALPGGSR
jgi:HEAT repeat protein